jgi:outer membrane protein TolC
MLSECVNIALDNNPQLETSKADIEQKESSLNSVKKDLYPILSFQYGYRYAPDSYFPFGVEDYYNYIFSIEQPLYKGKSLVSAVEIGELDLDYSKAGLIKTKSELVLAVNESYYSLLKTRKFVEVAEQSVTERKSHLRDSKAFYEAGLIPKNDMLQSEVQLAGAEIELVRAMNLSIMALANLNILLRRPVESKLEVEDMLNYEPSQISWEQSIEDAKKYRPEMKQSEITIEQSEKNIVIARAPYLPSISVSANYLKQGDNVFAQDWRFWAWGQGKDEVAAARHQVRKAQEGKAATFNNISLQVRQAYLDIKEAEINISVTEKAIEHAEEDFRINQSRYQAQLATSTNVLDAQTRLTVARINYYNALYNYRIALMKLAWATGTLVQN